MPTLSWIGKDKVLNHHNEVPYRILEQKYNFGDNGNGNMIIHGDNLEALKSLLPEFEGKVRCIYIDPPYNTGNENWIYNDNVNDPRIRKWLGDVVGKEGDDLSRHDKWLCMMYPRLRLLQKLLADDGAIFISIDDTEYVNLKAICDEIFGLNCFVSNISWHRTYSTRNDSKGIVNEVEHILCYGKVPEWNPNKLPRTEKMDSIYKSPDGDDQAWTSDNPFAPGAATHQGMVYAIQHPFTGTMIYPANGRCWTYSQDQMLDFMNEWCPYKLEDLDDAEERAIVCGVSTEDVRHGVHAIVFDKSAEESAKLAKERYDKGRWPKFYFTKGGKGGIRRKTYLNDVGGKLPTNFWSYSETGHTDEAKKEIISLFDGRAAFDTPKPTRLIERVLHIATDKDSIILDSFAGSGTTAHAVLSANKADGGNRRFILVEMEDYADSITAERVKRVIDGYGEDSKKTEGTGGGFSFYELGERLFLDDGNLNPAVDDEEIRKYIWFMETRETYTNSDSEEKYLLGVNGDTAYYFLYEKDTTTALNKQFLAGVKTKAEGYVIYADGMPPYEMTLAGVPQVCLKIPTGGGKTFIAANAVKPVFDAMPHVHPKCVVWLVPSDAILRQTYAALSDNEHPYRKRIDTDFGGKDEVYTKDQLLNGQNFGPVQVDENLSVFVLSYDSFRTSKKDGRKAYQQNGNLTAFPDFFGNRQELLPDTDETALIQVIRNLNPLVVVDESHHATSRLSVEMLENFNPCFVLELTATPKKGSNIISVVDARKLKKEEMVKLPVIVYNQKNQEDVYLSAIGLRNRLEKAAIKEEEKGGKYIRPIVLFQAQPRVREDSSTYDVIKKALVAAGVPEEYIAIKTGEKDEIKYTDLLSRDCPIRYIITVNALKEGWDCPFAYILATVANRSSVVDVEQILGHILRMPYAKSGNFDKLNISYAITSSADFYTTLEKVVAGLVNAGFSKRDHRVVAELPEEEKASATESPETHQEEIATDLPEEQSDEETNVPSVDIDELRRRLSALSQSGEDVIDKENTTSADSHVNADTDVSMIEDMLDKADDENRMYWESLNEDDEKNIDVPYEGTEALPRAFRLHGFENEAMKAWFDAKPTESKRNICKEIIVKRISKIESIGDADIKAYVSRVMDNMTEEQLTDLEQSPELYAKKIRDKVEKLLEEYEAERFHFMMEQDRIVCEPSFHFEDKISPGKSISSIPKSLYEEEDGDLNDYEKKVIFEISALDNVRWWHRNMSKREFAINGAVTAYPDLIVRTESGRTLLIETKGDHLDNPESAAKAKAGSEWANAAGRLFRYYMVFQTKDPGYAGAYSYEKFMEILKGL